MNSPYPHDVLPQAAGEDPLSGGRGGRCMMSALRRLGGEREARKPVGHQVDPQDLDRQQRQRQPEQRCQEDRPDLAGVAREQRSARTCGCCRRSAAPLARRRTIVAKLSSSSTMSRRFLARRRCRSCPSRCRCRRLQRRRIVDAVARHGDDLAPRLQRRRRSRALCSATRGRTRVTRSTASRSLRRSMRASSGPVITRPGASSPIMPSRALSRRPWPGDRR